MKWLPALIVYFLIFSCKESVELSTNERNKIKSEVIKTLENYSNDVNFNGLRAEFKYLDSSSSFYWIPPGYISAVSYDSVKKILIATDPTLRAINNRYVDILVDPLSSLYASYKARVISHTEDTAGKIYDVQMLETGVMRKEKNNWKLMNGHTSMMEKGKN